MIELKNIPKEEREKLLFNFEYYSCLIWCKSVCLKKAHKVLSGVIENKYDQELWVVLTHIGRCIRYGTNGYIFSLKASHYSAANKFFNIKISSKRMGEILTILHKEDYVVFYKGFYHKDNDSSASAVSICEKMRSLFSVKALESQGASRDDIDVSELEILDVENTLVSKNYNHSKFKVEKMKDVVLKNTRGMKGVAEIKRNLKAYNNCIEKNTITIDLGYGDKECNAIVYKRRFENDLNTCGRYYVKGTFQNLPGKYRPSIKINGEATVELDIKNCHPLMLASMDDEVLGEDFDCYSIPKLLEIGITRDVAKSMLFPILFSSSKESAIKAIRLKLQECDKKHISAVYVVDCFLEHNYFLEEYAYTKPLYGYLQHLDSSIATKIINHFTAKGVVVLCYHDSFRIQQQYEDELYQMIVDSYNDVVGSVSNLRISKS